MSTRLASRLILSHSVLAAILLVGIGVVLAALLRMTSHVAEVREHHIRAIEEGKALYGTAWTVEVESRRGTYACQHGETDAEVSRRLKVGVAALDRVLDGSAVGAGGRIRPIADGYRKFASRMAETDTCARLLHPDAGEERLRLDEELTEAWMARVVELHAVASEKEEAARRLGASAAVAGSAFGFLALLGAVLGARRVAQGVTRPLSSLAASARRVGKGEFSPFPGIEGPAEVEALAEELDRMRRRLAELDQLKQGFVASVSHELRTPLARLREALALLEDGAVGPLEERQRRVVKLARVACEREIRLVSALLDLSRVRAGSPLRRETGGSIDMVIDQAVADVRPEAEEREVTIVIDAPGDMPGMTLDAVLLERALANLLRNAVSVSSPGQAVRVERRVAGAGEPGAARFEILVRDEGPGVPDEVRQRLFQAFGTYSVEGRPERVGVGLGLALAREMLRAHGGDVELVDEERAGASFRLWLPLESGRSAAPSGPPEFDATAERTARSV